MEPRDCCTNTYSLRQRRIRPLFDGASSDRSRLTSQPTYSLMPDTGRRQVLTYTAHILQGQINLPRSEHPVNTNISFHKTTSIFSASANPNIGFSTPTPKLLLLPADAVACSLCVFRGGGRLFTSVRLLARDTCL